MSILPAIFALSSEPHQKDNFRERGFSFRSYSRAYYVDLGRLMGGAIPHNLDPEKNLPTMLSPMRTLGRRFSRPIRRGGTITMLNIITGIASARTGGTAPLTCYAEHWGAHSRKRYSRGRCMPHSLRAISTGMDMSDLSIGGCYGENGLAGEEVSVWVYENTLKIEYQATALSLYSIRLSSDQQQITEVKNPRRLETHFRSPQLDLWQVSDTEWLLALRRPEPGERKKRTKVVAQASQLVLPEFDATG